MDGLTLVKATPQDADVVFRLMQLYYFEASAWSDEEIRADGLYDCAFADVQARLQEEPEWTRLLWLDGLLCGFVQVTSSSRDDACQSWRICSSFQSTGVKASHLRWLQTLCGQQRGNGCWPHSARTIPRTHSGSGILQRWEWLAASQPGQKGQTSACS